MGLRRAGGPQFRVFVFPLPPQFSFFLPSLGGLLVEFWWCLKRRGPEMRTFGALGLSCETPAASRGGREGGGGGRGRGRGEGLKGRRGRLHHTFVGTKGARRGASRDLRGMKGARRGASEAPFESRPGQGRDLRRLHFRHQQMHKATAAHCFRSHWNSM